MKKNSKVSIIIPVYNGSNYLKEAIESALAQTYKNIEIVVVNDGSKDEGKTEKIALSYGSKIRYFNKKNGGAASALNFGIQKMEGEYFSWLSHDDIYLPNKVERQIEYITKLNNHNVILFADYELIDPKSRVTARVTLDHKMLSGKPEYALLRGCINGITLLIPKEAFIAHGDFDMDLKCTQDYDMWRRFMTDFKFIHMDEVLTRTRIHPLQDSNKHPSVVTEGNKLWIDMIESLDKNRKIALEGTEYNYYREMSIFLKETPYLGALEFCEKKLEEIYHKEAASMSNVKVSVIIPFYNRLDKLIESIKSVQKQTHKNLEIILINDGSEENLTEVEKLLKADNKIKIFNFTKNQGAAAARNKGLKESTGDYVAFLDSDDLFLPHKIEKQLLLMALTNSNISHTSYIRKTKLREKVINSGDLDGFVIPKILASCQIATPTVMMKMSYWKKLALSFIEEYRIGEDTCFWLGMLRDTKLLGIKDALTVVNVNENSASRDEKKQLQGISNILKFVLNDEQYSKYHGQISNLCRRYAELSEEVIEMEIKGLGYKSKGFWDDKPSNVLSKALFLFKHQGIFLTMKKVWRKYLHTNSSIYAGNK